jgi:hypothetical protein
MASNYFYKNRICENIELTGNSIKVLLGKNYNNDFYVMELIKQTVA